MLNQKHFEFNYSHNLESIYNIYMYVILYLRSVVKELASMGKDGFGLVF